ncbi:TonB-dependent receptor plug domain-containing protein [Psychrobacter aquimaris]|uniref:TonB-dependent receptor plug domain-containing protein n=1 Tax=Psychrobacter aquimaris TaxID=292733 RepID=UPI0039C6460D
MSVSRASSRTYLRLSLLSALGLLAVNTAMAATSENTSINDSSLPQVELDEIVVTATRTPTKTSNVIAQTRVINKEELQRYQGQTVTDVLKNQPGINITQSGGMGSVSNFYMRGYDSKQILVLIDGIRYSSISLGTPALNLLSADQIDRIEILYGASGSSIYGSDAMGGVIQIFTKGSNIEQNNISVTAGAGSHNLYNLGVNGQYTNQDTTLSLGISHTDTDGFNAVETGSNFNPDDDGFDMTSASLAVTKKIAPNVKAGLSALYNKSTSEFDGFADWTTGAVHPNAHSDQKNGSATAFIEHTNDLATTKLSYGRSIDEISTYEDGNDLNNSTVFDTEQDHARLESQIKAGDGHAILGLEHLKQKIDSTTEYDVDSRTIKSAFIGYQLADTYYDLQANYRVDDNSQYGNESTYNIGAAIRPLKGVRIGTSYATGFRAPTFNDLYFPGYENPNLKPETTKNTEIFVEYVTDNQLSRLTGYHTDAENLIASGENIGEAKIKGLSLTSDWQINSFLFGFGYNYLDAEDRNPIKPAFGESTYGNYLVYRPKNSGSIYVGYQQPKFDVRLEAKYTDERFSDAANTTKLDDYTLLNLSGSVYITPNLRANLRIDNITDEDYTLSNQFGTEYSTDGTNFFTSLTYNWY